MKALDHLFHLHTTNKRSDYCCTGYFEIKTGGKTLFEMISKVKKYHFYIPTSFNGCLMRANVEIIFFNLRKIHFKKRFPPRFYFKISCTAVV